MTEIWKTIKENSSYQVSNIGRVRSLPKHVLNKYGTTSLRRGKILKPCGKKNGYLLVGLSNAKLGCKHPFVHRLVALYFVGGKTLKRNQVNHKDGNKLNNFADNLEWVTAKENSDHAIRIGKKRSKGENNGNSKMTADSVRKMISLHRTERYAPKQIAKLFKMSESATYKAISGFSWKHIKR